jgi:hypothetical protein
MTIGNRDRSAVGASRLPLAQTSNHATTKVEDAVEFPNIQGNWVSLDRKPIQTDFARQLRDQTLTVSEADCICSHELATRLIYSLFINTSDDD